jgi:hypothetical protein
MGDEIGGISVHIGSRVAALAKAGEVLVSGTVKDLVAGSGLRFSDRDTTSLKPAGNDAWLFMTSRTIAACLGKVSGPKLHHNTLIVLLANTIPTQLYCFQNAALSKF